MFLIYLIVVLLAVWVFRDARKFGYRKELAFLWAMGVAIPAFTWIVFPLYLLWGRRFRQHDQRKHNRELEQATVEADMVIVGETAECSMCAKKVSADAENCPYCGYTLRRVCAQCGEPLKREWQYCPQCQTKAPEK